MKRLFGTDGIRAVAGTAPLDRPGVRIFGAALAEVLGNGSATRIVLGMDTRESGPWLRDAVASGLVSRDCSAVDAGVITTPGLAHVVRSDDFAAGVMISASHNPFADNGLKVFGPDGTKLSDELEAQIERRILDGGLEDPGDRDHPAPGSPELIRSYITFLEGLGHRRFDGMRIVVDCANGAAHDVAPEVFRHYGAEVIPIGVGPDGRNINLDCGSLHLDKIAVRVRDEGCDIGLAFDGDADRCLAVDRTGRVIDGDHILYIVGRRLQREGRLRGEALVATVMSNLWLEDRLRDEGVELRRAPVGDKYVLEQMVTEDLILGGEQSGHVIFREFATTGDGVLTGLLLLDAIRAGDEPLERILDGIEPYPQVLLNVRVREKPDLRKHPRIGPVVAEVESALHGKGRVLLRYSGTEPLARVMLEGKDSSLVRQQAEHLADVIRQELGA